MKTEIFSLGFRKITGPHVKTMERRLHPSQSMRNARGIWCITLSYLKTSVFVRLYEKPEFLKRCVFGDRLRRMRVDDRPDRRKNLRFQNKNGYVWTGPKGDVTPDNSQRRFLTQHGVAMLEQCWNYSKQCRNNIAKLCCAKNRRCESLRVTSP